MSIKTDKYQVFRDTANQKYHQKYYTEDMEQKRDFDLEQLQNTREDAFKKGIIGGFLLSGIGTGTLIITAGSFMLDGIRSGMDSNKQIVVSGYADDTYYVYVGLTETRKSEAYPQDIVVPNHYYIENEPTYTAVDDNSITDKVRVGSFVVVSGSITSVDISTFRDTFGINEETLGGSNHAHLDNLQGGQAGEYYHLIQNIYDILHNIDAGNEDKLLIHKGTSDKIWSLLEKGNLEDSLAKFLSQSTQRESEITINENIGDLYIPSAVSSNVTFIENTTIKDGGKAYQCVGSLGADITLWESDFIEVHDKESFIAKLKAYSPTLEGIKVEIEGYDYHKDTLSVTQSESDTLTSSAVNYRFGNDGTLLISNTAVCYIKFRVKTNASLSAGNYIYFTPPILIRKSKNGEIYNFRVQRTGTGNWTIDENTDNALSSTSISGSDIHFNFDTNIIDIDKNKFRVINMDGGVLNSYFVEGILFISSTGNRYIINIIKRYNLTSNRIESTFYCVLAGALTTIQMNDDINTNINHIQLELRRLDY